MWWDGWLGWFEGSLLSCHVRTHMVVYPAVLQFGTLMGSFLFGWPEIACLIFYGYFLAVVADLLVMFHAMMLLLVQRQPMHQLD